MRRSPWAAIALSATIWLAVPAGASATEFTVDRTDDGMGNYDLCTPAPNDCTLRGALSKADGTTTADLVSLPAGIFRRDPSLDPVVIYQSVTIAGAGARATVIEGPGNTGGSPTLWYSVQTSQEVNTSAIRDVAITKGHDFNGGGIVSTGTDLSLDRVAVTGNTAAMAPMFGSHGGGISFREPGRKLTIDNSVISGNIGEGQPGGITIGAGISVFQASATISRSTVANNVADGNGNSAIGAGLAVEAGGSITLDRVTVAGNRSEDVGAQTSIGNLWRSSDSTITAARSIIADGASVAGSNKENCDLPIVSQGGNVEDRDQCGLGGSDRRNAGVALGPLADNGGPTDTRAISRASAAFDFAGDCLYADQRGMAPAFAACDSGAFELQPGELGSAGQPGGGGPVPSPGGGNANTDPSVSALSLSRVRFRAAGSGPTIAARVGTTVSYTLSEAAVVTFRVERARLGRRLRGRCVKPTRRNRTAKRCTRYVAMRGSFTHRGRSGVNKFVFRGRLRGRKLSPGRYRLRSVAIDASGRVSRVKRSRVFRIVRR